MDLWSSDFRKVYFVISGFAEDFGYDIVPQCGCVLFFFLLYLLPVCENCCLANIMG